MGKCKEQQQMRFHTKCEEKGGVYIFGKCEKFQVVIRLMMMMTMSIRLHLIWQTIKRLQIRI